MRIHPEKLKGLRKKGGLSQEALAEVSGLTKKTIARIESGKGGETRGSTAKMIAESLGVKPEALTRAPESDAAREADFRKFGWRRDRLARTGETIVGYDLVREHYGVNTTTLIAMAPMLFTLLAEMSLADRRRRLKEIEVAADAVNEAISSFPHLPEDLQKEYWCAYNKPSISRRDLFAQFPSDEWSQWEDIFPGFLNELVESLGDNDAISVDPEMIGCPENTPLFKKYRERLTGGSARADYALSHAYVRLGNIPRELRGEDEERTAARVKWLEAQVPDEDWAAENLDFLDLDLDASNSSKEGDESV